MMVVGIGYDIHRLVSGRPLLIGGIRIPFEKGLLGHSDADVLLHAVCDACLGAAGLGDIGEHFPDTDPAYEGISSRELLTRTWRLVQERGFRIGNIDATVFAQAPRIGPFRPSMREEIARLVGAGPSRVNIKATTTEGLGSIGTGESIAALCVVLLESIDSTPDGTR